MRTSFASLLAVVLVGLVGAGDPTHEGVIKQMLAIQDKIAMTLATVKDQASANVATPELKKSAKEWVSLRTQAEKLPPPSRMEKDRLEKEYKSKLEEAQKKLAAEVLRVTNIDGGAAALKEIRSVLDKRMR